MTIQRLRINNYQSHADTDIELGGLTVLVGPSSAGKSAIVRAIKALSSNQTGKEFITHGQTTMQVSATTDKGTVVLTKGKPEDSYVISTNEDPSNPRRYTKLGVGVPEDVTRFLGIAPKDAINYAGQFDMPYLLRTSASEVARVLGELTNVSSIFEASREALRRKTAYSSTLRTREADLASLAPRIDRYEALPALIAAIDSAEASYSVAASSQQKLSRLNDLLLTLQTATARLKAASSATSAPLPDVQPSLDMYARLSRLDDILRGLKAATDAHRQRTEAVRSLTTDITNLDIEYDTALQEAMTCPTCGQSTEGVHAHV